MWWKLFSIFLKKVYIDLKFFYVLIIQFLKKIAIFTKKWRKIGVFAIAMEISITFESRLNYHSITFEKLWNTIKSSLKNQA